MLSNCGHPEKDYSCSQKQERRPNAKVFLFKLIFHLYACLRIMCALGTYRVRWASDPLELGLWLAVKPHVGVENQSQVSTSLCKSNGYP